jgi:hypothetical protein
MGRDVIMGRCSGVNSFTWEVNMKRRSETPKEPQGLLPFEVEEVDGEVRVTSYSGLPLVAEAYRATGAAEAVRRCVHTRARRRDRGLSDAQLVESFLVLLAAGGECNDDFDEMRKDGGLSEMMGYELPSSSRAKEFLYAFHDDGMDHETAQRRSETRSFVPDENDPLGGLHEALRATVEAAQRERRERVATLDIDATIIVSEKREAEMTYEGEKGYQPVVVCWAQQEMIVAEEFRDGNVPAGTDLLRVLQKGVETLPEGVERIYVRADSAAYEHSFLNWCRETQPKGLPIVFAVSADMSRELRRAIEALPTTAWQEIERKGGVIRSWAEVEFIPTAGSVKKGRAPDRYLAIRLAPDQREMFSDGSEVKYFAVVTNDWGRDGAALLEWHRQKAGSIERAHRTLKNELGAGVMPCGRFGANAAWFRLNALTANTLTVLKRFALPKELSKAQPKRLRFRVLCVAGQIVHHARKLFVRVARTLLGVRAWFVAARRALRRMAERRAAHGPPLPVLS